VPLRISTVSSSARLALSAARDDREVSAELAMTPLIGWALWQSIVRPGDARAPLIHALWTLVLLLPLGWLVQGGHADRGFSGHALPVAGLAVLCGTLIALPSAFGIHPLRHVDWLLVIAGFASGAAWRRRYLRPNICTRRGT
jgi:hypothetical protein